MRGTGLVVLNGAAVYCYFTRAGGALRLRLSIDEWDRLRLCEGQWVRVQLDGREPESLLVTVPFTVPPYVWVDLTAPAAKPAHPARAAG